MQAASSGDYRCHIRMVVPAEEECMGHELGQHYWAFAEAAEGYA